MKLKNYNVLLSAEQIQARVKELGAQITKDYQGKKPVVICTLKGAVVFFSDVVRNVSLPLSMEFIRLSSYKNGMTSGNMDVMSDSTGDLTGKDVIIIEDIVDSGKTLKFFKEMLQKKNPASVKICAFLDKPKSHQVEIDVDYAGFSMDCGFVVRYGLDYADAFRELPYLAEIHGVEDIEED